MDNVSDDLVDLSKKEGNCLILLRGSATVGHTLVAGVFDNEGLGLTGVTINYQWQQSVNGSWIDIIGETAQSLTLNNSILGQQVRVLVNHIGTLGNTKYLASSEVTVSA